MALSSLSALISTIVKSSNCTSMLRRFATRERTTPSMILTTKEKVVGVYFRSNGLHLHNGPTSTIGRTLTTSPPKELNQEIKH